MARFEVDGKPVETQAGDSLLVAMVRAGLHPTGGGCLCLAGDCPNCLVTADGVAYTRSCQVKAAPGMAVRRDHFGGQTPPLLPDSDVTGSSSAPVEPHPGRRRAASARGTRRRARRRPLSGTPEPAHHVHCDTVVIGQGNSGRRAAAEARAAGQEVVTLDAGEGQQVTGVYPGPLVVASDDAGRVLHVHPRHEIVVAAGAAEVQPVVPGSDLEGLLTVGAACGLAAAGLDFGRAVSLGEVRPDLPAAVRGRHVRLGEGGWDLIRFEGRRRLEAVVVRPRDERKAPERRVECDTAILDLGRQPRTALARMASDLPVRTVGSAAVESELPPCPREGTVCPCSGVTVADLDGVRERGFREMELLKRATLAGTGACQGGVCLPYLRSFLLERSGRRHPDADSDAGSVPRGTPQAPAAFTARPLNRQLTVRELAAGAHTAETARSPLHDEHLRLGARMDRAGGWWRPWTCGEARDEYNAVRDRVSLGDVSSLGKMAIAGPDAEAFLERIVPSRVAAIRPGRCRYVLMLDERGYALDDGMLCREEAVADGGRFFLTSTSGGSGFLELWLRDWAEAFRFDVRILNRTASLAAIHVTGPLAARLLARAGAGRLPGFSRHRRLRIAGIDCRVLRLSFTGELSYELHHAAADAGRLWRRLLSLGGDLHARPHGLQTLLHLRLEKGHIVVGQDTDYDSTPRRLGHEWTVDMTKGDFIGRQAVLRTNRQPPDRQLVALRMVESPSAQRGASPEGTAIHDGGRYAGYVTSAARPAPGSGGTAADTGAETGAETGMTTDTRTDSGARTAADTDSDTSAGTRSTTGTAVAAGTAVGTGRGVGTGAGAGRGTGAPTDAGAGRGTAMLGWLHVDDQGNLPREVTVDGLPARRVDRPLHDPDGERARVTIDLAGMPPEEVRDFPAERPEATDMATATPSGPPRLRPLEATRAAAAPAALDALTADPPWPGDALAMRIAADELLVTAPPDFEVAGDPHAIVERETGFSCVWLDAADTAAFLNRECDWKRPVARPTLAQGAVAGIPVKLWFETGRTLLLAPAPFAAAFQRRLSRALGYDAGGAA